MGLPEIIRVKISSEEAESINLTPVLLREMPVRELIGIMLGSTGKNASRLHGLLRAGSFVSGASRFRWEGFEAEPSAVEALLGTFPDPDPGRGFSPACCLRAVLRGPNVRIEITREAASGRRLLHRRSFWDAVMHVAGSVEARYAGYSYRDRMDQYEANLTASAAAHLRESAGELRYSTLEAQVRAARFDRIEFFSER